MTKKNKLDDVSEEILINYYNHQYDRMEILEGQSLLVTNLVISLSVVGLSFGLSGAKDFLGLVVGLAVLLVTFFVNLFAVAYILSNKSWKNTHQKRAKEILKSQAKALYEFDRTIKADYINWLTGRTKFQLSIHFVLVAVIVIVFIIYSSQLL